MFAIRQHTFGPPETLSYERVPDPEPAPGQLRIAVRAAGVHLLDTMLRTGRYGGAMPAPRLAGGPAKVALVERLDADVAVDYREADWSLRVARG
ncbi:MAG: NADPH:quinone reductase, partial [Pseudonocardiales bacterium]|nr:NADPH:quinone reductase [Pseudonocardiales bacterium]